MHTFITCYVLRVILRSVHAALNLYDMLYRIINEKHR